MLALILLFSCVSGDSAAPSDTTIPEQSPAESWTCEESPVLAPWVDGAFPLVMVCTASYCKNADWNYNFEAGSNLAVSCDSGSEVFVRWYDGSR